MHGTEHVETGGFECFLGVDESGFGIVDWVCVWKRMCSLFFGGQVALYVCAGE